VEEVVPIFQHRWTSDISISQAEIVVPQKSREMN